MNGGYSGAVTGTRPTVWLILPWSPHFQGGVSGVVRQLAKVMNQCSSARPVVVVDDWTSAGGLWNEDIFSLRLLLIADETTRATLTSLLLAPLTLLRTYRELRSQNVAAVNFHYTNYAPLGIALLKWLGLFRGRLVISFHGTDVNGGKSSLGRLLRAFCHRQADSLVACSSSLADRMSTTFTVDRNRISVVHNGVDGEVFRCGATPSKALQTLLPARFLVNIGSFIPLKAHADLLHAFALVAPHCPDLHLCIAGATGPTKEPIRALALELGLGPKVHLLEGLIPNDVAALLGHACLCVQPSHSESFPLSLLEAGAVGVPLAVSRIPGHAELVSEGISGRLFDPGVPGDCAKVILQMLADPITSRVMADHFAVGVLTELTWENCLNRYLTVYGLPRDSFEHSQV